MKNYMNNKIKYFLFGFASALVFLTISYPFLNGRENLKKIYWNVYFYFADIQKRIEKSPKLDFVNCLPELINYIPENSSIVIGHAYGQPQKIPKTNLNPKVSNFLERNKNEINNLFFTGDVFNIPSLSKWESLYNQFEDFFQIYIAPGNHDVSIIPLSRDVFDLYVGNKQSKQFPFVVNASGFQIVIDDSNNKKSIFDNSDEIFKNILKQDKDILFMRHHILLDKLSYYGGESPILYDEEIFEENLKSKNKIFFIYGNGGLACYKHKNITHILNGLDNLESDNILVLNDGNLYRYILRN